ncbi:hypothetical protein BJ742DRAFT_769345 [Cladochytrium replicatum]|nr:hypothetical protein BJ742DRAFT_769345 [Cladochytrium replicatum]
MRVGQLLYKIRAMMFGEISWEYASNSLFGHMDDDGLGQFNVICPGQTETGITEAVFEGARGTQGKIGQLNVLQGPEDSKEIAEVAFAVETASLPIVLGKHYQTDDQDLDKDQGFHKEGYDFWKVKFCKDLLR